MYIFLIFITLCHATHLNRFLYTQETADTIKIQDKCIITHWIGEDFIRPSIYKLNCTNIATFLRISNYPLYIYSITHYGQVILNNSKIPNYKDKIHIIYLMLDLALVFLV